MSAACVAMHLDSLWQVAKREQTSKTLPRTGASCKKRARDTRPVTAQIAKQQLKLFGHVARSSAEDPLRKDVFVGQTLQPQASHYIRRIGRPSLNWTEELIKVGAARYGSYANFQRMVTTCNQDEWNARFNRMFSRS
jgi:hypothetical protein